MNWIPVDRFSEPSIAGIYLITVEGIFASYVEAARWDPVHRRWFNRNSEQGWPINDPVIAWQPLPDAYVPLVKLEIQNVHHEAHKK